MSTTIHLPMDWKLITPRLARVDMFKMMCAIQHLNLKLREDPAQMMMTARLMILKLKIMFNMEPALVGIMEVDLRIVHWLKETQNSRIT